MSITAPVTRPEVDLQVHSILPSRKRAVRLFDYYVDHILVVYHIIHVPTVRNIIDIVYTLLEIGQRPRHDHIALLSTIFALSVYFGSSASTLQFESADPKTLFYQLILVAQQTLSDANYIARPTIETLQSVILIAAYLIPNMGPMSIFRTLMASALQGALQLSLHQIDSATNRRMRENTDVDWGIIESKRRIWWHLASTDWYIGHAYNI